MTAPKTDPRRDVVNATLCEQVTLREVYRAIEVMERVRYELSSSPGGPHALDTELPNPLRLVLQGLAFVDNPATKNDPERRRRLLDEATSAELSDWLDGGGRHSNRNPTQYVLLDRLLDLGRTLGLVVTWDGSFGEAEKYLAMIGRNAVLHRRDKCPDCGGDP